MIIAVLIVAGLCLGSFVNALVWRIHEQASDEAVESKKDKRHGKKGLSVLNGRSMCPECRHKLSAIDLVPVLSWINLRGKCRNCRKPISIQYPLVEITTAALFVASYIWWPLAIIGVQVIIFVLWLVLLVGLLALLVYDLRWMLLPNRIVYPLGVIAAAQAALSIISADNPLITMLNVLLAVGVGGGIFYILYQISKGKWIGGGDVKLGWLLGLIVGTPSHSMLFIFLASVGGSIISLPLLISGRIKRNSTIPFGPFLIAGAIVVKLFGAGILAWYQRVFLPFSV